MIKIRKNCFETNSSSTHAICIPDTLRYNLSHVDFGIGEWGWGVDNPEPEDYLYTAILELYGDKEEELQEKLTILKTMLNNNGISYSFAKPNWNDSGNWRWLENGGIDHGGELSELVEDLLNDESLLLKYLAGAQICTGNDNSDSGYDPPNNLYDRKAEEGWRCYWKGN